MIPVNGGTMLRVAGQRGGHQAEIIAAVGPALQHTLEAYAINTHLRIAHFLAQTCHESDYFSTTVEYASGDAYEGRKDLGNTHPGDGRRYKGRGLIQLTGRANYRKVGEALHVDLEGHPERAAEPVLSLRISCEFWKEHGLNALCDQDDIKGVTKRINGGLNGLKSRTELTERAKAVLQGHRPGEDHPVLRRGARGDTVELLQRLLAARGFPELKADGDFGPATEAAVRQFQSAHKLEVDGVVGPNTWAALEKAPPTKAK
jgi:putative chitinase